MIHKPVMTDEILRELNLTEGDAVIDATVNGGGHARLLADAVGANGRVLGIDRDCALIHTLESTVAHEGRDTIVLTCRSFKDIKAAAEEYGMSPVAGVLFDLGFSSHHVDEAGRGFSFKNNEPLDMRYDMSSGPTAAELLGDMTRDEIEEMITQYGEDQFAHEISCAIAAARAVRPITMTHELVDIVRNAVPMWYRKGRVHYATKTFQALRMVVNDELRHIEAGARDAISLLAPGGRIAVVSFHSLEDRLIKTLFADFQKRGAMSIRTKRPLKPTYNEVRSNKRARSAKLRVAEKLP